MLFCNNSTLLIFVLFFDILACTRKRVIWDDVHAMGSAQKKARIEPIHIERPHQKEYPSPSSSFEEQQPLQMVSDEEDTVVDEDVVLQGNEVSIPIRQEEEDFSVLTKPSSPWWDRYRDDFSWITLDGVAVAVTLSEFDIFIQKLPFLECVLPSMQAGEPYFVPVFVEKMLLPLWEQGRGHFSKNELAILELAREQLFPAISGYLELLSLAAILEQQPLLDASGKVVCGMRTSKLSGFIHDFFGVSPIDDFLGGDPTLEALKLRVAKHLPKIPSMLMIGHQWGFDLTKIAASIKGLGCLDPSWLQAQNLPHDRALDLFLDAVTKGMSMPDMPKTVPVIAWTMCPEFTCSINLATGKQTLQIRSRFKSAPGRPTFPIPSMRSVLQALKSRNAPQKKRRPAAIDVMPHEQP